MTRRLKQEISRFGLFLCGAMLAQGAMAAPPVTNTATKLQSGHAVEQSAWFYNARSPADILQVRHSEARVNSTADRFGWEDHPAYADSVTKPRREWGEVSETGMYEDEYAAEDYQVEPYSGDEFAPPDVEEFDPYEAITTAPGECGRSWVSQVLPAGLLYRSYAASPKESRFALQTLYQKGHGWIWEVSLGGRVGIYRYGTEGAVDAEGWQIDIEGAGMPRLDLESAQDVTATDYRFGIPITYRRGATAYKVGYYHISSHLGDEFMLKNPTVMRRNYVRESAVFGVSQDVTPDWRLYGELGYALHVAGGAKPLEIQLGTEWASRIRSELPCGAPFAAINGNFRQDFDFQCSLNVIAGWQWRGPQTGHVYRIGGQYYNGQSIQYSFFDQREELTGLGMWFDY